MYKNILSTETALNLNSRKSKSDFLKTAFKIGSLINAINNVAEALIPPEFEKKSTERPNKKLAIRNMLLFFLIGNRKTHTIYTKGFK